jgi:N6-L-threonylcarbamoyladenine synthase
MDEFSCCIRDFAPVAVGVSTRPRALEGSYMPCFLSGISAAHAFAAQSSLPIYETAHQNGHIMAALYSSGEIENLMSGDFLAFHVSGGTTEVLKVTPNSTKTDFNIELVGESKDINAGQAIDRIGVMMGLAFPAGRELERLAQSYDGELEKRKISVRNGCCNLSGVENIAKQMYDNGAGKNAVAAFTFDFIERTLTEMAEQIFDKHQRMPILFAGGVMSNKIMRQRLSERFDAYFAEPEFSSDNAAGVALLCRLKHAENKENG